MNAVAAAVGAFFRELPTPLVPKEHYTDLLRTIGEFFSLHVIICRARIVDINAVAL